MLTDINPKLPMRNKALTIRLKNGLSYIDDNGWKVYLVDQTCYQPGINVEDDEPIK